MLLIIFSTLIFAVVGWIVGATVYAPLALVLMLVGGAIGALVGYIINKIYGAIDGVDTKIKKIAYFVLLTLKIALIFNTIYYRSNFSWNYFEFSYIFNWLLHPIAILGGCITGADKSAYLIVELVLLAICAVINCVIFFKSGWGSTASEHQGKYKVTVMADTGQEVSEREYLDPDSEAFKTNAIISLVIVALSVLFPFLGIAFGYALIFQKDKYGVSDPIPTIFSAVKLAIVFYVALFLLTYFVPMA